jgi:sorting nexin-29
MERRIICPIRKKGDLVECANYRSVSLLNTAYKLCPTLFMHAYSHTLKQKLDHTSMVSDQANQQPTPYSSYGRFNTRRKKGRSEHASSSSTSKQHELVIRMHLYKAMDELGIPRKLTRMVRATMEKTSSSIRAHTSLSDPLLVTNG